MSTPESLLKMDSLEAVKQVLIDNLPAWVQRDWLTIENIRPKASATAKETLAEMTFSSFYAPPAISAKFKDPLTFQFDRLSLATFLAGVDKKVKFKGSVSAVDILSRLLAKYDIPVSALDVVNFTTETAGSYVINASATSPRWVGSVSLELVRDAYLLQEFFNNTDLFIPFAPSFRSDDFLKVLLKAIENHNSSYEEPYTLKAEDFRITAGPTSITPDDNGVNTRITLTGVGGDFTGSMDFTYQRKSYTSTYRWPVVVATGGVITRAKVLDAINFKFDTGLVETDVSNWATLPATHREDEVHRLTTFPNSLTTVGDIYVKFVMWDESNQVDLATEITADNLPGFVLEHTCKIPLEAIAPNKLLDGFIPPYEQPNVEECIHQPFLDGFTSDKKIRISEVVRPKGDGFDSTKQYLISEILGNKLTGFQSDKKRSLKDTLTELALDGFDSDKLKKLSELLGDQLDGFESDKLYLLGEALAETGLDGYDSDKKKLLSEVVDSVLDGFESDKKRLLSELLVDVGLNGWDSLKKKHLAELVEPKADGFESDKSKLLSEVLIDPTLNGWDSAKKKHLAEILGTDLDGFEGKQGYLLSQVLDKLALDGFDSVKLKHLAEVVGNDLDGFDGKAGKLIAELFDSTRLDGFETTKLKKRLSEVVGTKLDGFEGKTANGVDLANVILITEPNGLWYPAPPVKP